MIRGEIITGDAREVLAWRSRRPGYDPTDVVMFTDPPWRDCEHVPIAGSEAPVETWAPVARKVPRIAGRLILWLGRNSDPRGMVDAVPSVLPFATVVTLRLVPPGYRGPLMAGDVAYVFGRLRLPAGKRVLPGELTSNAPADRHDRGRLRHPCPRSPSHARDLLRWYAARASLIIDPFCGSGTVLAEAAKLGLPYLGIDVDPQCTNESRERVERVERQGLLNFKAGAEA